MNAITPPATEYVELPSRGGRMAVRAFGRAGGPADVVFSHANGFNALTYRSILEPLRDLKILAIDLRGHGASELPAAVADHQGWTQMADDLLAFLAATIERPVVLAGHSMGGTTSLLAAARSPAQVRSLVLFDPVLLPGVEEDAPGQTNSPLVDGALRRRASFPSRQAALDSYRGRGAFRTWSEAQLQDYVAAGFVDAPPGGVTLACAPEWEAANYRTHRYDPAAALRDSRCPIRLFKAEQGSTTRLDAAQLAELTADGRIRVETVAGASHFLPMERPDLVQAALRAALA